MPRSSEMVGQFLAAVKAMTPKPTGRLHLQTGSAGEVEHTLPCQLDRPLLQPFPPSITALVR